MKMKSICGSNLVHNVPDGHTVEVLLNLTSNDFDNAGVN